MIDHAYIEAFNKEIQAVLEEHTVTFAFDGKRWVPTAIEPGEEPGTFWVTASEIEAEPND